MANGKMGSKTDPQVKQRGMELLKKGNTIQQVAKRIGLSESLVRLWSKEMPPKAPDDVHEPENTDNT